MRWVDEMTDETKESENNGNMKGVNDITLNYSATKSQIKLTESRKDNS